MAKKDNELTNIKVIKSTEDIAEKNRNVFLEITRDLDDVNYWTKRLDKVGVGYKLVMADGMVGTKPMRYIRGYVIYTLDGVIDQQRDWIETEKLDETEFV